MLCLIFVVVFGFVLNQMRSPSKSNGLLPGWPVSGCGLNGPEPLPYQSPPPSTVHWAGISPSQAALLRKSFHQLGQFLFPVGPKARNRVSLFVCLVVFFSYVLSGGD